MKDYVLNIEFPLNIKEYTHNILGFAKNKKI